MKCGWRMHVKAKRLSCDPRAGEAGEVARAKPEIEPVSDSVH